MKAVGLIVEYNPFHNGHKLHLQKAKEISKADISIAIMSGNFLQRGEPSLLNKWLRARMAIENGVDIVIELPSFYSNQSAEIFAEGAVKIADRLLCDSIVFGSEEKDINKLIKLAQIQLDKNNPFHTLVKEKLEKGLSYPNSLALAYEKLYNEKNILNPNNILGIEYIKALKKLNSKTKALNICREKVGYFQKNTVDKIASATGIRQMLRNKEYEKIKEVVPEATYNILINNLDKLSQLKDFYHLIRFSLIKDKDKLQNIQDMEEGLWNRLYDCAKKNTDFDAFIKDLSNPRYTQSRINRVLSHILLGIETIEVEETRKNLPYIRVLAYNEVGAKYMKELKKEFNINFIISLKNAEKIIEDKIFLDRELDRDSIYKMQYPYKDEAFAILKK